MEKNNLKDMKDNIKTKDFEIINNTPQMASIYPLNQDVEYTGFDNNYLILDFGEKKVGDLVEMNMTFRSNDLTIKSTSASCGCTNPILSKIDDNSQLVVVKYDTNRVAKNISKAVTLYLSNGKKLKFNLIMNK